jgi:hypothetical protein
MKASAPLAASELGVFDRFDVMAGRADWTWPDYVRAGGEWIDAEMAKSGKTITPAARAHHACCWAETNCPPSKRKPALEGSLTLGMMEAAE